MSKIESGEVEETYKFYRQITNELEDLSQGIITQEVNNANPQCKSVEKALEEAKDLISNNLCLQNPRILDFMFASLKIGNILLVGPPGVGKTEIATTIADSLCSKGKKVTANALWTRRDLIGGETLREGSISWKPGVIDLSRASHKINASPVGILHPQPHIRKLLSGLAELTRSKKIKDFVKEKRKDLNMVELNTFEGQYSLIDIDSETASDCLDTLENHFL